MPVLFFRAYLRRIASFLLTMSDRDDHIGLSRPFAAYILRLTLFLLTLADLNDRQGLFSPAIPNEPRHACI